MTFSPDGWQEHEFLPVNGLTGIVIRDHDSEDATVVHLVFDGGRELTLVHADGTLLSHVLVGNPENIGGHVPDDDYEDWFEAESLLNDGDVILRLSESEARAVKTLTGLGTIHLTDYALDNAKENGFEKLSDLTLTAGGVWRKLNEDDE